MNAVMIRHATPDDTAAMAAIYNHYITDTTITFEETPITPHDMQTRLQQVQGLGLPWLVVIVEGKVAGYTYATKWKERSAYRFSVEATVYLSPDSQRKGLGTALYQALFKSLKTSGIHSVIGGVTLPNPASVALHEKLGMEQVARFKEVGYKFNQWLDVGYWQLVFK